MAACSWACPNKTRVGPLQLGLAEPIAVFPFHGATCFPQWTAGGGVFRRSSAKRVVGDAVLGIDVSEPCLFLKAMSLRRHFSEFINRSKGRSFSKCTEITEYKKSIFNQTLTSLIFEIVY